MTVLRSALACALAILFVPPLQAQCGDWLRIAADDLVIDQRFGFAVAISGDLVLVGCDLVTSDAGSAYVFDATTGEQLFKLAASDASIADRFGTSVALSGTTAIIGAPGQASSGAVYVFDVVTGRELTKIEHDFGPEPTLIGRSVAIDGTTALIGALGSIRGAALLVDTATGARREVHSHDGLLQDSFGWSVAVSGGTLAIGSPNSTNAAGVRTGAVYVYDVTSGFQRKILAGPELEFERFGHAVALEGSTLLVGVPYSDPHGHYSGSAYLYDVSTGALIAALIPDDTGALDRFGFSVAIDGDRAVVGAWANGPLNTFSGAAYVFDAATGQLLTKLIPGQDVLNAGLGFSVGLSGSTAVAGAPFVDVPVMNAGCAYVIDVESAVGLPYCFGYSSACPCSNLGAPTHGCANGAFPEGARLCASGSTSISAEDLTLTATSSTPHQPGLFFQGDARSNDGYGTPFGDGFRCAEGNVLRLQVTAADAGGTSSSTLAPASANPGDVKRYQWWYRDPSASPCGSGFNLSNGLELIWGA